MTQRANGRELLRDAFLDAVRACDGGALVERALAGDAARRRVWLFGAGKAAVAMARGAARSLGAGAIAGGLIVTKDGHAGAGAGVAGVEVREAAHPVPDVRSEAAGHELLARVAAVAPADEIVAVWSGGASALACVPAEGLSLAEKAAAARAVAAAGAPIWDLNDVRKHLSAIKGGRLGAVARAPVTVLVLSDVFGDDLLTTVGGAPFTADPTTFAHALDVIDRHGAVVPPGARALLEAGARGEREETVKPGDPRLALVRTRCVGDEVLFAGEMAAALERRGVEVVRWKAGFEGTVDALAAELDAAARELTPGNAVVIGGEPIIRLGEAPGRGGRAQHTALLVARAIAGLRDVVVLCAGSDGSDGPTLDAGAIVDGETAARAGDVDAALAAFDSGSALARAGALLTTGATGTNLCDVYVAVRA